MGEDVRRVSLAILLVFLVGLVPSPLAFPSVAVQSTPTLYVDPPAIDVFTREPFSVDVAVGDVDDLVGFEFYVGYNTTILNVLAASIYPPFHEWGGIELDDPGGYVHAYALLPPVHPPVSGSHALLSITFNATSVGSSSLHLYDSILADSSATPIPHTLIDSSVTVYRKLVVPDDYPTIQAAINIASEGDTVFVRNGTYLENIVVNKTLSIIGEETTTTIVDGSGKNQSVIEIVGDNITLSDFTVQNSSQASGTSYAGVKISGSGCTVTASYISKTKIGILVASSEACRLLGNIIRESGQGIAIYDSSEVSVSTNNFTANTVGISLAWSSNNTIMNNQIANSSLGGHGIALLSNSTNNTIVNNNIAHNYHGIWLSGSTQNIILENTILNNMLLGIELSTSPNNTFYHNNLINNPTQVVTDNTSICIWDDGCEGNYWSSYNGTDFNFDGIGDTPHLIELNNTDHSPLMNPYWSLADINHDLKVDIFDAVSICFAYSSTPSDFNWNCHCDITKPYDIIDIYDVVTMANNYGAEYSPP